MSRIAVRRIVVGLILLASACAAFMVASARWEYVSTHDKPVRQAYAVFPGNPPVKQYGAYCNQDGTKLEGGGMCYINEFSRRYTPEEIVHESGSLGFGVLFLGAIFAAMVASLMSAKVPEDERDLVEA